MIIFLYIVLVLILIFIGFILFKGYTLLKDYKNMEEKIDNLHSQEKKSKNGSIKPIQSNSINNHNNSIQNQKYNLFPPKIIIDNKIYSQQEFFKETNNGNFQMSSMLKSKLYGKSKKAK